MIKTLEERKQEIVDWCQKEYLDKNKQWRKLHDIKYKTTKELLPDLENYIQTADSFFIKKDYHIQLLTLLLFLGFGLIVLKTIFEEASILIFACGTLVFLVFLVLIILGLKDKSIKVVLTKDCFWFEKMEKHIPWKFLATLFIKEENKGEDSYFYLVLHYYNEKNDVFEKFEYDYRSLEMDIEDICFHIEKFKEKNNAKYQLK
jgi:hypothetical protein